MRAIRQRFARQPGLHRLLTVWLWFIEKAQPSERQRALLWAGFVGVLGGLAIVMFRTASGHLHMLLTGQDSGIAESFQLLPRWKRLLIPAIGAAAAGLIISFGKRLGKSRNTTDYMEAVALGNGVVSFRSSIMKIFSSMFSVAAGESIGREGSMVQLSTLFSSLVGQINRWPVSRRRLIVACGASAGLASAYNAPIGGALFVAEIVMGSIAMETFGPLVIASVLSTQVIHYLGESAPIYGVPHFEMKSGIELIAHLALGVLCGALAPVYLRLLRTSERGFGRLNLPSWARLGMGGLIVGSLAVFFPQVCGNGYSVVGSILHQHWVWSALAVLLVAKVAATCATFGSGAVGGVFTPTLFMGASVGYLFGTVCEHVWPGLQQTPGAFALVGMGVFLAGATHAPLMSIIMIFEMTLDYQIILPLMMGCVFASQISQGIEAKSMYRVAMERKGEFDYERKLATLTVGDLMKLNPVSVREAQRFADVARLFIAHTHKYLYVVDEAGVYKGAISLQDIKEALNMTEIADLIVAQELARSCVPTVTFGVSLSEALEIFKCHDGERLPVVSDEPEPRLIGAISKTDVIIAMTERVQQPRAQKAAA